MARVALLSAVNIKHMAMISMYQELLKKHNIEYDLIYMDKYDIEEKFDCHKMYRFVNVIDHDWPKNKKRRRYFKFRKYAKKILEANKYDFIIVWNDVAIYMFSDYLATKWRNKYCLNIRDTQKKKPLFKAWFKIATDGAAFNTVSSDAYLPYLPKGKYMLVHSYNRTMTDQCAVRDSFRSENEPIRIVFVGKVRFMDYNKRLLDVFANDDRFCLGYYGMLSEELQQYAQQQGIKNADFFGEFPIEDTWKYIDKTDIINNFYGNDTVNRRTALSQKLYYGIGLHLPILATEDTYTAELVNQHGIGFSAEKIDEELPDKLYEWYRKTSFADFQTRCDDFMKEIITSQDSLEQLCMQCLGENDR